MMTTNDDWIVVIRRFVAAVGDMAPGSRVSKQTMGEGTDLG